MTILYIWTIIAVGGWTSGGNGSEIYRDWRHFGEYNTPQACAEAIRQLALNTPAPRGRCVSKGELPNE